MSKLTTVQSQIQVAKQAQAKLKEGDKSFKAKKYTHALKCYLYAFDNGHLVPGWGGVRLSFVPSAIARLGKIFPPALQALKERRDAREKLIERGETNFNLIHEWTALNRYLNDKEHELLFIYRLQKKGRRNKELEQRVIVDNKKRLLKQRDYSRLKKYLNVFAWSFLVEIASYQSDKDFPSPSTKSSKDRVRNLADQKGGCAKKVLTALKLRSGLDLLLLVRRFCIIFFPSVRTMKLIWH